MTIDVVKTACDQHGLEHQPAGGFQRFHAPDQRRQPALLGGQGFRLVGSLPPRLRDDPDGQIAEDALAVKGLEHPAASLDR
jgi:hypothetical protein